MVGNDRCVYDVNLLDELRSGEEKRFIRLSQCSLQHTVHSLKPARFSAPFSKWVSATLTKAMLDMVFYL